MHGFSVEFAEHRLYNPGEATKNIDWKVYARTDKLFTKKYEEETNLRCHIVIDASSSMYFPADKKGRSLVYNKLEFSALAAASLMNLLKKQRDAYALSLFSEDLEFHSHCKSSTAHYRLLINQLSALIETPKHNRQSFVARNLHHIAEAIHRRSMVIIFSDMFNHAEETDEIFAALQHLRYNKHEVVVFHVVDKQKELDFDFENRPYEFVDMETGERVKLQSNQVKEFYVQKMHEIEQNLRTKCLQYKIDFVETDINQSVTQVLMPYLMKRNRMRI